MTFLQSLMRRSQRVVANKKGMLLLDSALALAGIGILVGAIWGIYSVVGENRKQSQWDQQLLMLTQNIRRAYAGQSSTGTAGTDITSIVQSVGVFPSDMTTGGSPTNPWGGALTVIAQGSSFDIQSAGLTIKACMKVASANTDKADDVGLTRVIINAANITTFPISLGTAEANCSNSGTGNSLTWRWNLVN